MSGTQDKEPEDDGWTPASADEMQVVPAPGDPEKNALESIGEIEGFDDNLWERYLIGKAESTKRNYRFDIKAFAKFAKYKDVGAAINDFVALDAQKANRVVHEFQRWMVQDAKNGEGLSAATVNRRIAALKAVTRIARTLGKCDFTIEVDQLRVGESDANKGLSVEQARMLIKHLKRECRLAQNDLRRMKIATRNLCMIRLMLNQGFRRMEVLSIRNPVDVSLEGKPKVRIKGKGDKNSRSWVYITKKVADALELYLLYRGDTYGELFLNHHGCPMSLGGVNHMVGSVSEAAGCPTNPHALRHTCGTVAQTIGEDIHATAQLLRHNNINNTQRYDDSRKKRALDLANKLSGTLDDDN